MCHRCILVIILVEFQNLLTIPVFIWLILYRIIQYPVFISGALSGLAGVTYYLGYFASIQPKVLTSTGFDAIAVSLLGNSNPVGIIFSSFLITVIGKGSTYMSSASGIQQEIASVITGIILLFSACGAFIRYKTGRLRDMTKTGKEEK